MPRNPYGLLDGRIVTVDEVDRGLACGCHCPSCGRPLKAHKGDERRAYFSHYGPTDCGAAYESALHLIAKEIIQQEKRLLLPELEVTSDISIGLHGTFPEREAIVEPWKRIRFDEVFLEQTLGNIVPDVRLTKSDRQLFVEIRITHKVDKEKLAKIKDRNVATIEYDFSKYKGTIDRQAIRRALVETYVPKGQGRGTWIYHPKEEETVDRLTRAYREKYINLKPDSEILPKQSDREQRLFPDN